MSQVASSKELSHTLKKGILLFRRFDFIFKTNRLRRYQNVKGVINGNKD